MSSDEQTPNTPPTTDLLPDSNSVHSPDVQSDGDTSLPKATPTIVADPASASDSNLASEAPSDILGDSAQPMGDHSQATPSADLAPELVSASPAPPSSEAPQEVLKPSVEEDHRTQVTSGPDTAEQAQSMTLHDDSDCSTLEDKPTPDSKQEPPSTPSSTSPEAEQAQSATPYDNSDCSTLEDIPTSDSKQEPPSTPSSTSPDAPGETSDCLVKEGAEQKQIELNAGTEGLPAAASNPTSGQSSDVREGASSSDIALEPATASDGTSELTSPPRNPATAEGEEQSVHEVVEPQDTAVAVHLPSDLATKILRKPSKFTSEGDIGAAYDLPDGIRTEVQAAAACAFLPASQVVGSDTVNEDSNEDAPKPYLSLYYPHDNCHEVIDSMVDLIAVEQSADVLVLDSLELAIGKNGAFGQEVADTLNLIYLPPWSETASDTEARERRIQGVVDALVNLQLDSDKPQSADEQPQRRIIYMQDFGAVVKTMAPLMRYVLQAIRTRRDSPSATSEGPIQPTLLILGFAKAPVDDVITNKKSVFIEGGQRLRDTLPPLQYRMYEPESDSPFKFLTSFTGNRFLPSLGDAHYQKRTLRGFSGSRHLTPLQNELKDTSCFCIFPKDAFGKELQTVQRQMIRRREQKFWNALIAMFLEHKGAKVCEDPLSFIHDAESVPSPAKDQEVVPGDVKNLEALSKRIGVTLPMMLNQVLTLALQLATADHAEVNKEEDASSPFVSSEVLSKAFSVYLENYKSRSDWLKRTNNEETDSETSENQQEDPVVRQVKGSSLAKHEKALLKTIVDAKNLATSFEDVCIPSSIIESLRTIVSLPLLHPAAFKKGILSREGIGGVLLYGPPGTGKTMVCRALAGECKARMLQIKPSDVQDMWVGETEKLVAAIFTLAYKLAPCVVFIDEIDALFRARTNGDSGYQRDMLNEFMQAMDGLSTAKQNKDAGIVVIGATNRPFDLDDAILRRLPARLMVDLPGPEARARILRVHLSGETVHEDVDVVAMARKAENYSGSDLKNVCVSAAMASVKEMIGEVEWNPKAKNNVVNAANELATSTEKLESSSEPTPLPTATKQEAPDWDTRSVAARHFEFAFTEVPASSRAKSHAELQKWHRQFGAFKEALSKELAEETTVDPVIKQVRGADLEEHETRLLHTIVDLKSNVTSFDDVCISPSVIESLRTIVSLPLLYPVAFKTGILRQEGMGGVLLYGPPGTGKTMVCRALAGECKARMIQIKPSDVLDKWVGETEKLVTSIFSLAHRLAPCIIFIDEIDALFRARTNEDSNWRRDMINEFMQAMDGLQSAKKNKEAGIVIVGATNRPYDLDDAIVRRLPTRMMVDLPGAQEREQILRVHLAEETLHEDLDITAIAHEAENYSGSDLRNLCVSAAMASLKDMIGTIQWNPNVNADESRTSKTTQSEWGLRAIKEKHFQFAFTEVLASSTTQSHSKLYKWHEHYGGQKKATGKVARW
ncbi:putative AAA domain-containing protein C16E9.10c [Hypsizygus marmoreus]|uniref:AAA domain-containing protein C16E9.10c n=1 Tax=Hypsizygus marmoreus TaxID=39966 RepID=A0A369K1X9_HYPMA|nr:putative AAA domain-containing protein C16E9.10c [Hypsizygus marmoreus]